MLYFNLDFYKEIKFRLLYFFLLGLVKFVTLLSVILSPMAIKTLLVGFYARNHSYRKGEH